MWSVLNYLPGFLSVLIIIVLILYFIGRSRGKHNAKSEDQPWYNRLSLSKEESISETYYLLFLLFFGLALSAINHDLQNILSWKLLLFIFTAVALAMPYVFKALYNLPLGLIGFIAWWNVMGFDWVGKVGARPIVIFAGGIFILLIYYLLGRLHEFDERFKRLAQVYIYLGLVPLTVILFAFSSQAGLLGLDQFLQGKPFASSWQAIFSLIIFGGAIILLTAYSIYQRRITGYEAIGALIIFAVFAIFVLVPGQSMRFQPEVSTYDSVYGQTRNYDSYNSLSASGWMWIIIFNVLVFFQTLGIIFLGYIRREIALVNMGAFFLFALIVVKYFDWFFSFLDKSFFFISAGILLFVVGWILEKGRRYMVSELRSGNIAKT